MGNPTKEGDVSAKGDQTPATEPDKTTTEPNIDELLEQAREEVRKESEGKLATLKKEISTRDQTITKLQKDVNATKSEEERKQIEAEERHKTVLQKYSKLAVKAAGLDESFSDLITGNNEDEIDSKIEAFMKVKESIEKPHLDLIKTHLEKIKSLEEEINILKASGAPPKGGTQTEPATLQSSYDEAKKKNDFALQTAIKRQAAKEGVTLRE